MSLSDERDSAFRICFPALHHPASPKPSANIETLDLI
jgi:hypothetical protein